MAGPRFFLSDQDVNEFNADQWLSQQQQKLADDWLAQQQRLGSGFETPPAQNAPLAAPEPTPAPAPPETPPAPEPAAPAPAQPSALLDLDQPAPIAPDVPLPSPSRIPSPAPTATGPAAVLPSGGLVDYARQAAQRAGIDPDLFVRQINQESGFNPGSRSPAGAIGIAQIVPRFHPNVDPTNPTASLDYAANLMANLTRQYGGDIGKALVAYNGGQGAVDALNSGKPYGESQQYLSRILGGSDQTTASASSAPGNVSLSQFGDKTISYEDAYSACGPAAAARLAAVYGNNIPLSVAIEAAKRVGWTPGGGMNGIANEKKLMDALNLPSTLDTSGDWGAITSGAQTGMVTISTPLHYFSASGTRQRSDGQTELYVGQSGLDLKAGKAWMTPQEIEQVAGKISGALFSDPSKAVAAGEWMQRAAADHGVQPESPDQALTALDQARQTAGISAPSAPGPLDQISRPFGEAFQNVRDVAGQVGGGILNTLSGAGRVMQQGQNVNIAGTTAEAAATGEAAAANQANPPLTGVRTAIAESPVGGILGAANTLRGEDPFAVMADLNKKYGTTMPSDQMTPEDRKRAENAMLVVGGMTGPVGASRFFHGTGGDFPRPDAAKFDPNGLFGPGYYLTDSPQVAGGVVQAETPPLTVMQQELEARGLGLPRDVAGTVRMPGYAQARGPADAIGLADVDNIASALERVPSITPDLARVLANGQRGNSAVQAEVKLQEMLDALKVPPVEQRDILRTAFPAPAAGPNVRAVDVPQGLRLLDADAPLDRGTLRIIEPHLRYPEDAGELRRQVGPGSTGSDLFRFLQKNDGPEAAAQTLASAGFDGIRYSGGQRIPMTDAAGAPIEHTALVVFPESLDKLTNAISGRAGGAASIPFATTLGGAATGGAVAYQTTDPNDPNRGLKIAGGALTGGGAAYGAGRLVSTPAVREFAASEEGSLFPGRGKPPDLTVPRDVTRPAVSGAAVARQAGTATEQATLRPQEADRAANILLSKFPEDVRPHLTDAAETFGQFAGQRRGVISDPQAEANAAEVALGTTPEKWIKTPAGRAFNQEQAIALGNTLAQVGREYDAQLADVLTARAAGTATSEMEAGLASKTLEFGALAGVRSGAAAEAGRALRAFRQTLEGTGYANRNKAIDAAFKAIGGNKEQFAQWVEEFSKIPATDPVARYQMLRGLQKPSWWDRISILRYASMLSSTTTHLVNAFGNTVNLGVDIATKPVSVGLDVARAGVTGGERTRYMGELAPQVRGLLDGAVSGFWDGWTALRTGINPRDAGKFESIRSGFQSGNKVVDFAVEAPLRALTFADNVFRGMAFGSQVRAIAARQGIAKGLSGDALRAHIDDVVTNIVQHPDIADEASGLAARTVLQEPNTVASAITSFGRGSGADNVAKRIVREIILPFAKTPANILNQGMEMTPYGLLKTSRLARAGDVGGATDAAARVAFGSALMVGVGAMAANGMVTGGYPADPKERDTLPTGWQPWSLRLPNGQGGHNYISFSQLGPVAVPLAVAAIAGQSLREGVIADPVTLGSSLGKFMVDQTFLQGLSSIIDAVKDPKRYGENVAEQMATSFVPYAAMSREITRITGQADRDPKGAIQAIQALIPGVAETVPRRQDALGRDIHSTQTGIGAALSPARYSADQPEPILEAFRSVGLGLPSAPKEFRVTSQITGTSSPPIALNEREQKQYQALFGQRLQERLTPILSSPAWNQRTAEARKKELDRQVQLARDYAEGQIYRGLTTEERQKRMKEGRARQQVKPLPVP